MTAHSDLEIRLYTRPDCHLCEVAGRVVRRVMVRFPARLEVLNVDEHPDLEVRYGEDVPVVVVRSPRGERIFRHRLDPDVFETEVARLWNR